MFKILDIFRKSKGGGRFSAQKGFLLHKYDHFKNVLTANNARSKSSLTWNIDFTKSGPIPWAYVREQTRRLWRWSAKSSKI